MEVELISYLWDLLSQLVPGHPEGHVKIGHVLRGSQESGSQGASKAIQRMRVSHQRRGWRGVAWDWGLPSHPLSTPF